DRLPFAAGDRGTARLRAHPRRAGRRLLGPLRRQSDPGGRAHPRAARSVRDPLAALARLRPRSRRLPAARDRGFHHRGPRGADRWPDPRSRCRARSSPARAGAARRSAGLLARPLVRGGPGRAGPRLARGLRGAAAAQAARNARAGCGTGGVGAARPARGRGRLAGGNPPHPARLPRGPAGPTHGGSRATRARRPSGPRGSAGGARPLARGAARSLRAGALRPRGAAQRARRDVGEGAPVGRGIREDAEGAMNLAQRAAAAAQAYRDGAYEEAVQDYQALVDAGAGSADVWFNLGNAHYHTGARGKAAWAWENALRLAPRDEVVRRQLENLRAEAGVVRP